MSFFKHTYKCKYQGHKLFLFYTVEREITFAPFSCMITQSSHIFLIRYNLPHFQIFYKLKFQTQILHIRLEIRYIKLRPRFYFMFIIRSLTCFPFPVSDTIFPFTYKIFTCKIYIGHYDSCRNDITCNYFNHPCLFTNDRHYINSWMWRLPYFSAV